MSEKQPTLWDFLTSLSPVKTSKSTSISTQNASRRSTSQLSTRVNPRTWKQHDATIPHRDGAVHERYRSLVIDMKARFTIRVRKWRASSSGCAWEVHYTDGTVSRLIESPYPTGPISCAIFLHEVGHHAIGFGRYRPRCLEEYHAWMWSLSTMHDYSFNITRSVEKRVHESLQYAVYKARRRGLRALPVELVPYLRPWDDRQRGPTGSTSPITRPSCHPDRIA